MRLRSSRVTNHDNPKRKTVTFESTKVILKSFGRDCETWDKEAKESTLGTDCDCLGTDEANSNASPAQSNYTFVEHQNS